MAITIVQISPKGEGNNVASASASFTALPTAGNAVLVCAVIKRDPGHANSSCTDNQGNTYAKQIQFVDTKNQAEIWADFDIGTPSGTYTVTLAGNYNSGNYIALYLVEVSGLVTTGVLDQSATGTTAFPGTPTSVGPTSATDTADELVMAVISFESTDANLNITLPTGYTEIGVEQSSVSKAAIEACYKIVSATGTQAATWNHDGTANTGAVLATFRAAGGTVYTLPVDAGSYALTGAAVTLRASRRLVLEAGAFSLTGAALALLASRILSLGAGSYVPAGADLTLVKARLFALAAGACAISGTALGLRASRRLALDSGSYALTGADINLVEARVFAINVGTLAVSGTALTLRVAHRLVLEPGTVALTGAGLGLRVARTLACSGGSTLWTGQPLALTLIRRLVLAPGDSTWTGSPLTLAPARRVALAPGAYLFTGGELGLLASTGQTLSNRIDVEVLVAAALRRGVSMTPARRVKATMGPQINRTIAV